MLEKFSYEHSIYALIFALSNRIETVGSGVFEDLTIKQHFLMLAIVLSENPPYLKEISELIGSSYQNLKVMAETLKRKGYLDIEPDKDDRRKLLLISTGRFEKVAEKMQTSSLEFFKRLYQGVSMEELIVTKKCLNKMNSNIGGGLR